MPYRSTKTWGHDLGLSACFRQWRAESHCSRLHGYALAFTAVFEADQLDANNWVVDFGALGEVRDWLRHVFDHVTVVAQDDPLLAQLQALAGAGGATLCIVPNTGCEAFAKLVFDHIARWLVECGHAPRVRLVSVECREHGANSALYVAPTQAPVVIHAPATAQGERA